MPAFPHPHPSVVPMGLFERPNGSSANSDFCCRFLVNPDEQALHGQH